MTSESLNDALIECVKCIGGSKAVGVALWPAKGVEAAQRQLLACLNPERNEKLSPDELMHILRMARDKGCHEGMHYLAHALSYSEPTPIEPKDEAAEIKRQLVEATHLLAKMVSRLEAIEARPALRSAA